MDPVFTIAIVLHVLPAVFWAGATFVVARGSGENAGTLFGPQMGSATLALLAGAYLWFHVYGLSAGDPLLGFGALCAIAAAGVQGALVGRNRAAIAAGDPGARARAVRGNRIAAGLLAVTIITMVVN